MSHASFKYAAIASRLQGGAFGPQPSLDLPTQEGRTLDFQGRSNALAVALFLGRMDFAMSQVGLERQITTALESAIRSDRLDIAEHLIDALGVLRPEASLGSPLASAYLSIAETACETGMAPAQRRPIRRRAGW